MVWDSEFACQVLSVTHVTSKVGILDMEWREPWGGRWWDHSGSQEGSCEEMWAESLLPRHLQGQERLSCWWRPMRTSCPGSAGNESDQHALGCRFYPWPCSVGWGSGVAVSCGVGCILDPALLWLWCRLAAVTLIQPLAWELTYAASAALKRKNKTGNRDGPIAVIT